MQRIICITAAALILASHAAAARAADLVVEIHGAVPEKYVHIALFKQLADSAGLDKSQVAIQRLRIMPDGLVAHLLISALAPGRYALSAYADLNDNQMLDTNLFGMPTEPYGASRNTRNLFGPPTFGQSAFVVDDDNITHTINLQ